MSQFKGYAVFPSINGYDLSSLVGGAKAQPAQPKKPLKLSSGISGLKGSMKLDEIDTAIKAMELDKHPEYFETILEEQGLLSFWKQIVEHESFDVIKPIAVNRVLNFFEGATKTGLSHGETKTGIIVCIVTSALVNDRDNVGFDNATAAIACFYPYMKCDLSMFTFTGVKPEEIAEAERLVSYFAKSSAPTPVAAKADRLGTYLINSMRMWILSDDQEVLGLMALGSDRFQNLKDKTRSCYQVRQQLGIGNIYVYRTNTLLEFDTPWSRGKNMVRNGAQRLKNLRQL